MDGPVPETDTRHGRIVDSGFRPHPLMRGPHLQTMVPALLRPTPRLKLRIERRDTADGDWIALGWSGPGTPGTPLIVLIHGLTGSFESKYLRGVARKLLARGWRTVILQLRGAGPEPNRLARCYNHGDTADLKVLIDDLHRAEPKTPLLACGWSLGANVLLKYLGESGRASPLRGAIAVSAPLRLAPCAEHLRQGFSRVYQNRLLRDLCDGLRRKHHVAGVPVPNGVDLDAALAARDFIAFDDAYTAPLHGYRDAADYYARCESGPFLKTIGVPTEVINAIDDPFMVPEIIPPATALAPLVQLSLSEHGGHVGFVEAGRGGLPTLWLERKIPQTIAELLEGDKRAG